MPATNRTKRYFISDIHLSNDSSHEKSGDYHPYSWTSQSRIDSLVWFLNRLAKDPTTKEVVILGDLFDNWVCPASAEPPSFEEILDSNMGRQVVDALWRLPDSGVGLTYVFGNHDMLLNAKVLIKHIDGIKPLGNGRKPEPYIVGSLIAEHGHRFCLFNNPATGQKSSFLPSGYPMTRILTQVTADTGQPYNMFTELSGIIHAALQDGSQTLVDDIILGMAIKSNMKRKSKIQTGGLYGDDGSVTVEAMMQQYKNDFSNWGNKKNGVTRMEALYGEVPYVGGNLQRAADSYFPDYKVVIFGHTHEACLYPNPSGSHVTDANGMQKLIFDRNNIYANCGSWTNDCQPSFIEVELKEYGKESRRYVRRGIVEGHASYIKNEFYVLDNSGD